MTAIIAPDFGAGESAQPADLDNEIYVKFLTLNPQGSYSLSNTGFSCWDQNNSGTAVDDFEDGQECVPANAAVVAVAFAIPVLNNWGEYKWD